MHTRPTKIARRISFQVKETSFCMVFSEEVNADERGFVLSIYKPESAETLGEPVLVFRQVPVEDEREGVPSGCPTIIGICDGQIDRGAVVFCPYVTRNLLAS